MVLIQILNRANCAIFWRGWSLSSIHPEPRQPCHFLAQFGV